MKRRADRKRSGATGTDGTLTQHGVVPDDLVPSGMTPEEAAERVKTSVLLPRGLWVMTHDYAKRKRMTFQEVVAFSLEAVMIRCTFLQKGRTR